MAKKLRPIFVGIVNDDPGVPARLRINNKSESAFIEYLKKFKKNEQVKVVVTRLTKTTIRSVEQNNYYWGVVLKILAEHFGYIGVGEKEELHDSLRTMFLVRTTKLGLKVVESTTKLDTELFERYLQAVRDWAIHEHQCRIPKPNEVEESDDYTKI
jgi:hypothetical protein